MLSSNNGKEQLRKQQPKRQRFTLKKLTVGVASVLIGFTFMGISASADSTTPTDTSNQTLTNKTNNSNSVVLTGNKTNTDSATQSKITVNSNQPASQTNNSQQNATASNNQGSNASQQAAPVMMAAATTPAATTGQTQNVSDWSGLINAVEDANVGTINLDQDITVTGKTGNLSNISTKGFCSTIKELLVL